MRGKLSEAAYRDLESIWRYTFENWSGEQADRYVRLLMDEIRHIGLNPSIGRLRDHIRSGYRSVKAGRHVIFYVTKRDSGEIENIRMLHERMDIQDWLFE